MAQRVALKGISLVLPWKGPATKDSVQYQLGNVEIDVSELTMVGLETAREKMEESFEILTGEKPKIEFDYEIL